MISKEIAKHLSSTFESIFRCEESIVPEGINNDTQVEIFEKNEEDPMFAIYIENSGEETIYTLSIYIVEHSGKNTKYVDTKDFLVSNDLKTILARIQEEINEKN